ncbi:hypothetical protein F4804DRAFT_332399 [Jackrogersella minutella]|nr:hypothetical protein F4804DRAFT_332399 [Jackrogersella minutella]
MKMLLAIVTFVTLFLGQGIAQDAAGILPCAAGCVSGVFANAPNMGCALNDILCVCGKTTDFSDGIRDCVNQACPAADVAAQLPIAQASGTQQCQAASSTAGLPTPAPTSPAPAPVTSSAQSQETQPTQQAAASSPSTTAAAATESSAATGTIATTVPSSTPVPSTSAATTEAALSVATDSPSTSEVSESSAASSATSLAMSSATTSVVSGIAGVPTEAAASADQSNGESSTDSGGLSVAARAGIGAACGVAFCALGFFVWYLISRCKKKPAGRKGPSMQISQPLPGSGRQYASNIGQAEASLSNNFMPSSQSHQVTQAQAQTQAAQRVPSPVTPPYSPSAASYSSELDANARRYEDLSPLFRFNYGERDL